MPVSEFPACDVVPAPQLVAEAVPIGVQHDAPHAAQRLRSQELHLREPPAIQACPQKKGLGAKMVNVPLVSLFSATQHMVPSKISNYSRGRPSLTASQSGY